jgi:hypothetical protein
MNDIDRLLDLSGQFEPFIPSIHLCTLTDSLSVMAGLDTLTRQAAAEVLPAPAAPAAPAPKVLEQQRKPAPPAPQPAERALPPQPTPRISTSRKDYLPALQDPRLVQALLARAARTSSLATQTGAPTNASRAAARPAPPAAPEQVQAQPKPRPFRTSSRFAHTMPILSTNKERS